MTMVGAGICQLDKATRPNTATPMRTKNEIAIRVIVSSFFPANSFRPEFSATNFFFCLTNFFLFGPVEITLTYYASNILLNLLTGYL